MDYIENALKAARETKALRIGEGVLPEIYGFFNGQFPGKKAVVIADGNTFRAAGKEVYECLLAHGATDKEPFIFTDKDLYAEYSYVEQLAAFLHTTDAIPVAVGSGTINDLVKLASHLTGREYLCVATAASMDGYTAFGASITARGAKQTFNCPAPRACLADTGVIRNAPPEMTASGYADLFAKITAGADWILADALGVEPIDRQAWSIVQDGLHDALAEPGKIKEGDAAAITKLTEGLMLGGFAMQWSQSSRPASGAEHQFSHLWNMQHHLNNGRHVSHGFQVSIGTLAITALYEQMLKNPPVRQEIEEACQAWPSREESDSRAREMFSGTGFPEVGVVETGAKYIDKEQLRRQLTLLADTWPEIKERLGRQLVPFAEAKERLALVGAPVEPEEIGLSRDRLRDTYIRAQFIRRRFTVLDLAVRANKLTQWLDGLFKT